MSADMTKMLIIGTGHMAGHHAEAYARLDGCPVVAGVDTDQERLDEFCDRYGIAERFTDIDQALAWNGFDAATNVTPDAYHKSTSLPLIEAGKHVLCEKPLAQTYADANDMAEAAHGAGIVNMINLTFRNRPVLHRARSLIEDGTIGAIRHVDAHYFQSWLVGNHWGDWREEPRFLWRLSTKHGSPGALGDIGIHVLDAVIFVTGLDVHSVHARLQTFPKAEGDRIGDYPLTANDSAALSLQFAGGALGMIQATRYATGFRNAVKVAVFGTEGALEARVGEGDDSLRVCSGDGVHNLEWETVDCPAVDTIHTRFVGAIRNGGSADPDFRRGATLQRVLDRSFESAENDAVMTL